MGSVMNNERNPHVSIVNVGTIAATKTLPGLYFRKKSRIKNVVYVDQAGVAADNTNFLQLSLQDLAALEYATLDTRAAGQGALTAMTAKALAQVSAQKVNGELEVPAGTNLQVVATKNGTGVSTLGALHIEWYTL